MIVRRSCIVGLGMACLASLAAQPALAEVSRFEVLSVERETLEGRSFGDVGTYDRIKARATVEVDPADRRNAVIVDIDRAPRNAQGKVEAVADVEILVPSDPKRSNGKLLYEVVNRGNKLALGVFNDAASNALAKAADAGNGYLLRQGYTLVWSGWQGDLAPASDALALSVPTLTGVTDRIFEEFVFNNSTNPVVARLSWPASDTQSVTLTVRARWEDSPASPSDLSFRFLDPSRVEISRPAGFDGGAIYKLDYVARDPKVLGLGFAATRDIVSYLRRESPDNPLTRDGRSPVRHAYAYGQSISGRFLREFLYLGFNEDLSGRAVFDGMLVHVTGARLTAVNMRFGVIARAPRYPQDAGAIADRFPFTYAETTNPFTRKRDGLLKRCTESRTCPKIIQADGEYEWYHSRASLLVTDPAGKAVKLPPNVRLFTIAGTPHVVRSPVAQKDPLCIMPTNPLKQGPVMRALLSNLDAWVDRGVAPPASRTPTLSGRSLVAADAGKLKKRIPGVPYTAMHVVAAEEDLASKPGKIVGYHKLYLPRLDSDGMMMGGVRLPAIEVPKATYTGWNPRVADQGATTLCPLIGGAVAFAATREEREKNGDPRPSLEERYSSAEAYVAQVEKVARALVRERLMLEEDVVRQRQAAIEDTLAGLRAPQRQRE